MHFRLAATITLLTCIGANAYDYLTATALVTNAKNHSAFECWRFTTPLATPSEPGIQRGLSFAINATNAAYTILPPRFDGGRHNSPAPQIVSYTTGLAHITLPDSDDEAWFIGGNQGLLVAADTNGDGHFTDYPSEQSTVVLTLPFPGGVLPPHEVISTGPCHFSPIGGGLTRRD